MKLGEEKIQVYLFRLYLGSVEKDPFNLKTRIIIGRRVGIMAAGASDIKQFNFGILQRGKLRSR